MNYSVSVAPNTPQAVSEVLDWIYSHNANFSGWSHRVPKRELIEPSMNRDVSYRGYSDIVVTIEDQTDAMLFKLTFSQYL